MPTTLKLRIGQWVTFKGEADSKGQLIAAHVAGSETFLAKITSKPYGLCYGLSWRNGSPVGFPAHDHMLTPAKKPGDKVCRRLPRGGTTKSVRKYIAEWRKLGAPIEKALGGRMNAFDPGISFIIPDHTEGVHLATHVAVLFSDALTRAGSSSPKN